MAMTKALTPIAIGPLTAKNRIAVSAHSSGLMCLSGDSSKLNSYVEARAFGGVGLFILGETLVHDGAERAGEAWGLAVSQPGITAVYRTLAATARQHGMLLLDQLSHLGGQVWSTHGAQAFAPSPIAQMISGVTPAALDDDQIERVEAAYVEAARRAVDGGLDGVEIKCDQGKLLHQFLSSNFNQRRDQYGGDVGARVSFPLRIARAIRNAVPEGFVMGVRVTFHDYASDEEARDTTAAFLHAAKFDYVNLSAATNSTYTGYVSGHGDEGAAFLSLDDERAIIRTVTSVPLMLAGKIQTLDQANTIIGAGQADLVAMTRAHIADPEIVRKYHAGQSARIRPCIACNQSCVGNTWEGREVRCIHNIGAGREDEFSDRSIGKTSAPGRLVIIGGGPAGMEAARVAGLRGHQVSLYEAEQTLGGQLLSARLRPGASRIIDVVAHLEQELRRLPNVHIHLGTRVGEQALAGFRDVDRLFVAIGSADEVPTIDHGVRLLSAQDALTSTFQPGDRVLVADEDWIQNGLGISVALLDKGAIPEIITTREAVGLGLNVVTLISQTAKLRDANVAMSPLTAFAGVKSDGSVRTVDLCTGREKQAGGYAAVVLVKNRKPLRLDLSPDVRCASVMLGDCVFPRGLEYAIRDGNFNARF